MVFLFSVAGPDRPIPQPPKVQRSAAAAAAAAGPSHAAKLSAEAQGTQSNLYARLSSALSERGCASVLLFYNCGTDFLSAGKHWEIWRTASIRWNQEVKIWLAR